MRKEYRDTVDEIMDYFDFNGLLSVMKSISFGWVKEDTMEGELRQLGRRLLMSVAEHLCKHGEEGSEYYASSGGLEAKGVIERGKLYLELKDGLFSWDNYN